MALTISQALAITDALATIMLRLKGDSTNGLGDAEVAFSADGGARGQLWALRQIVDAYTGNDYDALLVALTKSGDQSTYQEQASTILSPAYSALEDLMLAAGLPGVTSLTSYFLYYNTGAGGPYAGLVAPSFGRGVYNLIEGKMLDARNVYAPAAASFATKTVAGVFTAGTEIDRLKYAGAARAFVQIASRTGTGLVSVVGEARSAAGEFVTGRAFTAEVTNDSATLLTPAIAGDLLLKVTGITLGAGITAGTATVSGAIPAGRTVPA